MAGDDPFAVLGGGSTPGPVGVRNPVPLGGSRIIADVAKDWNPPNPRATPEIVVRGSTLSDAARGLNALDEWGQAGGSLRADRIPGGNSTDLTVNLRGNLVYRLPRWTGYSQASTAAKAEWDRMFGKLRAHEDRHLVIAIEEGDQLASDLVGHDITDIARMVTAANRRMRARQDDLDANTDHGAKAGVPFGDVTLDTSIV
ncbi:MAG: DUF922 domain-containing protein [Gammaproteobacteria bacterium]